MHYVLNRVPFWDTDYVYHTTVFNTLAMDKRKAKRDCYMGLHGHFDTNGPYLDGLLTGLTWVLAHMRLIYMGLCLLCILR